MVIVRIISGPRAGQQNLVPMRPEELVVCSREGWRWRVQWDTVPEDELFEWARQDMVNKIMSALIRGATVQFLDQSWQVNDRKEITEKLVGEIEDTIVYGGYNVLVESDEEDQLVIGTHGTEYPIQQ